MCYFGGERDLDLGANCLFTPYVDLAIDTFGTDDAVDDS